MVSSSTIIPLVAISGLAGFVNAQTTTSGLSPFAQSAASSASAAAATASTSSSTSKVKGKVFDHFVQVWLENTDYDKAAADKNLQALAAQGISLTQYHGLTHPSEPNYVAVVGGSYFGIGDDALYRIPSKVATVVDLLEEQGISWAEYQEDMPYTGYQDFNYTVPSENYVEYVIYDSVATVPQRLSNIKNFTLFQSDLEANLMPQWSFCTPNMKNDGHDTGVAYAGNWSRSFIEPLLNNSNFMNNTLVLLTFDETATYTIKNRVFAILLGDVIPDALKGTRDSTVYTHYSSLSTVQNNWGLYNLGRGDVNAQLSNVFQFVANATGYKNVEVEDKDIPFFNFTSSGFFDALNPGDIPAVLTNVTGAGGRGVLPSLKGVNGSAIPASLASSFTSPASSATSSAASGSNSVTSQGTSQSTSPAGASGTSAATPFAFPQKSLEVLIPIALGVMAITGFGFTL